MCPLLPFVRNATAVGSIIVRSDEQGQGPLPY
jgi:hypothetical protein